MMHTALLLVAIAPLALAYNTLQPRSNVLEARQGNAFIPGSSGYVRNCQNICGSDCLRPSRGDTCCSEGYGCPGGSFCLTEGYCCPDGDDPVTCARRNGITLSAGFVQGSTSAISGPATSSAVESPSSSASTTEPPTSSAAASTPSYSAGNTTIVAPTGVPLPPTSTAVPFTGDATGLAVGGILGAAIFGVVGWLV